MKKLPTLVVIKASVLFMAMFLIIFTPSCSKNKDTVAPIADTKVLKLEQIKLIESNFTFDVQAYFIGKRIDDEVVEYLYDSKSSAAASCTEEISLYTRSYRIKVKPILKKILSKEGTPTQIEYFPFEFDVFIDAAYLNEISKKKLAYLIVSTKKSEVGSRCLQSFFVREGIPIY